MPYFFNHQNKQMMRTSNQVRPYNQRKVTPGDHDSLSESDNSSNRYNTDDTIPYDEEVQTETTGQEAPSSSRKRLIPAKLNDYVLANQVSWKFHGENVSYS